MNTFEKGQDPIDALVEGQFEAMSVEQLEAFLADPRKAIHEIVVKSESEEEQEHVFARLPDEKIVAAAEKVLEKKRV